MKHKTQKMKTIKTKQIQTSQSTLYQNPNSTDNPAKAAAGPTKHMAIDEAPFFGGEGGDDS